MELSLPALIEAMLFWSGEPLSVSRLAEILGQSEDKIREAADTLAKELIGRGLTLLVKDDALMLGTHPAASKMIEKISKEELARPLGRAGLETLATILYRGPMSRAEIDYLRGVNSGFILRHLLVRGLVERVPNPGDARSFWYRSSFALLQHLGINRPEELPEYDALRQQVQKIV